MSSVKPPSYYEKDVDQLEDNVERKDAIETFETTVSLDNDDPKKWSKYATLHILPTFSFKPTLN